MSDSEGIYIKELNDRFEAHCLALGKIAFIMGRLTDGITALFCLILKPSSDETALAIWNSITSDRAQFQMFKDAVAARYAEPRGAEEVTAQELIWLAGKSEDLLNDRNNAIHAPTIVTGRAGQGITQWGIDVWDERSHPRAVALRKMLKKHDLSVEEYLQWIHQKGVALARYARDLYAAMDAGDGSGSWPDRPILPTPSTRAKSG